MTLVINVMDERGLINKVIPAKGDKGDAALAVYFINGSTYIRISMFVLSSIMKYFSYKSKWTFKK